MKDIDVGDEIIYKREHWEVQEIFKLATDSNKVYVRLKSTTQIAGYKVIEHKVLIAECSLYHRVHKYSKKVCTCGTHKVFGPNCPKEYHADYCDCCETTYGIGLDIWG